MRSEIVEMTPQLAKFYLGMNTGNRLVKQRAVESMAEAIQRGEWKLTPQGVIVSSDGRLLDGQHRLNAIVRAGVACQMVVWHGVNDDIFSVLDTGIKRSQADVTNLHPKVVNVLNIFHALSGSKSSKATAEQLFELNSKVGAEALDLILFAGTAKRGFSNAGARAAVVVLTKEGYGEDARNLYKQLTNLDFDGIPEITKMYVKQVLTSTLVKGDGGGKAVLQMFYKALIAFDPRCAHKKQLFYGEDSRRHLTERVAGILGK